MSLFTRFRRHQPAPGWVIVGSRRPRGLRRVAGWLLTALAGVLVLAALVAPNEVSALTPAAFLRLPVEALVGAAVLLVVPPRARRIVAAVAGVLLGALAILKILDAGFTQVLDRQFDPVLDWILLGDGVNFLQRSVGKDGAIGAVVAAVLLAVALLVLTPLSVVRLSRLAARHRTGSTRAVAVGAAVWITCALLGAQVVPNTPVASSSSATLAWQRLAEVRAGLHDQRTFTAQAGVDAYRDTPGQDLLGGLRGKDVIVAFVESYGRAAVEDPQYAPQVGAVLDAGTRRLNAAGYASRSGWLTSPTAGGGSWLAQSTLLSGMWINNQQRYRNLVTSDRLSLNSAFHKADWRTVGVMPAITRAWPEGLYYGYDQLYTAQNNGFKGPYFNFGSAPDQYTLAAFQQTERDPKNRRPVMAEIALLSSHTPWAPLPQLVDWDQVKVGDGRAFLPAAKAGKSPDQVWKNPAQVRAEYTHAVEYTLNTLVSYVEHYGDDNLVLVFLGDHQPAPIITGEGASRDVPITIVAKDRAVMDRTAGWHWQDGLRPGPDAPVWQMSAFRDRFLAAFGA